jgi:hypothetical protein
MIYRPVMAVNLRRGQEVKIEWDAPDSIKVVSRAIFGRLRGAKFGHNRGASRPSPVPRKPQKSWCQVNPWPGQALKGQTVHVNSGR